jgi:hypothetical protein
MSFGDDWEDLHDDEERRAFNASQDDSRFASEGFQRFDLEDHPERAIVKRHVNDLEDEGFDTPLVPRSPGLLPVPMREVIRKSAPWDYAEHERDPEVYSPLLNTLLEHVGAEILLQKRGGSDVVTFESPQEIDDTSWSILEKVTRLLTTTEFATLKQEFTDLRARRENQERLRLEDERRHGPLSEREEPGTIEVLPPPRELP